MKTFKNDFGIFNIFNNDIENNICLKDNKLPQQKILDFILPYILKINTLIDVGSSVGIRNIYFSKINPSINIYCFEPRENLFYLLVKNIATNNIQNIVTMNNMLGHGNGNIKLSIFDRIQCDHDDLIEISNGSLIDNELSSIHFITLDSLKLLSCDFIYIDLRGYDYIVLLGGINTIKKYKPLICFKNDNECNDIILSNIGIKKTLTTDSFDLLKKLEYNFTYLDNNYILAIPIKIENSNLISKEEKENILQKDINNDYLIQSKKINSLIDLGYQIITDI